MTPIQSQVLQFIYKFWNKNKYSPSLKEIQEGINTSSISSLGYICNILASRGFIIKFKRSHRGLEITEKTRELFKNHGQDSKIS